MIIRKLQKSDDITKIANIYVQSWKHAYKNIISEDYLNKLTVDKWIPYLETNVHTIYLAISDDKYVGIVSFDNAESTKSDVAKIYSIYVLPEYQNKGIGKILLYEAIKIIKATNFNGASVYVIEQNISAQNFYRKNDFKFTDDYLIENIADQQIKLIKYYYKIKEKYTMEYKGTLIAVKDIKKAKQFYETVLGLKVVMDAQVNIQLTGGVFLQTMDTWIEFINKKEPDIMLENNAMELYFETDDMDSFIKKLETFPNIDYIHPVLEHSWGQRAIRFYDLDKHIIEVAENITMVARNFIDSGMSIEQIAKRFGTNIEYVSSLLKE